MIRELILVSADISAIPRSSGMPVSKAGMPADMVIKIIRTVECLKLFDVGPVSAREARARLLNGDRCVVILRSSGLYAQMWCTQKTRFIEWIGCRVEPLRGHLHLYNSWVHPEMRGRGLQWLLAQEARSDALACGMKMVCAGVERKEYPAFARKYASMKLGLLMPYSSIWTIRIGGVTIAKVSRTPTGLEAATAKARDILNLARENC